jgi:adenosylmethionine-8-amino-7-oxononanoate aminotransferase
LWTRALGDIYMFSPPLSITAAEVDKMLEIVGESIAAVA